MKALDSSSQVVKAPAGCDCTHAFALSRRENENNRSRIASLLTPFILTVSQYFRKFAVLIWVLIRKPKELHMVLNHRYKARFQFKVVLFYRGSYNRWSIAFRRRRMIVFKLPCSLICRNVLLHVYLLSVVRHLI